METRLLKESYLEVVNYSVTHKNGNRSSVRTDILNSYIRQFFFDEIIDLLKAMEKGIGKNAQNYGNTTVGECERLYGYSKEHGDKLTKERKDDVTIFITLAPSIELDSGRRWKDMSPHVENLTLFNPNIFKLDVLLSVDETKETEEERINSLGFIDNEKEVVEIVSNIKEII